MLAAGVATGTEPGTGTADGAATMLGAGAAVGTGKPTVGAGAVKEKVIAGWPKGVAGVAIVVTGCATNPITGFSRNLLRESLFSVAAAVVFRRPSANPSHLLLRPEASAPDSRA